MHRGYLGTPQRHQQLVVPRQLLQPDPYQPDAELVEPGDQVVAPGGAAVPGPVVPWKGRRHGRRQNRRWARAWSPEQVAHRLRLDFPEDETMRISHEAIYRAL